MKKILFIALFITTASFAQKTINNYKYVIVPNKFDFVKRKRYLYGKIAKSAVIAEAPSSSHGSW